MTRGLMRATLAVWIVTAAAAAPRQATYGIVSVAVTSEVDMVVERVMAYLRSAARWGRWLALFAGLAGVAPAAHAQDVGFRVVVNEANGVTSLTREDVGKIFLKKTTRWESGVTIAPVDQRGGARVRSVFSDAVHGRSATAIVSYWQQQIFSGRGVPPVEKDTDAEVIEYVRTHPGAVGYVSPGAATDGVRVIEIVRTIEVR